MPVAPGAAVLTFSFVGAVFIGFVLLGLIIWLWGSFLDVHEHNPARVRSAMTAILAFSTLCELGFSTHGWTCHWVGIVALVVNLWGGLDALLRYPAAHDFESFFAVKQVSLLLVKTFSYAFGINGLGAHVGTFLVILLVIVWGLPVLYLMAMPLDEAEQVAADEHDNVDLIVRLWRLLTSQTERQRYTQSSKKWFNRRLLVASQKSVIAKIALCAASPTYRRSFSKGCRSV